VSWQVTEKLHERAAKEEPNKDDFIELANRVEEFTLRFLDPLTDQKQWREAFALNPGTDVLLDTAIKLNQKKVKETNASLSLSDIIYEKITCTVKVAAEICR